MGVNLRVALSGTRLDCPEMLTQALILQLLNAHAAPPLAAFPPTLLTPSLVQAVPEQSRFSHRPN